MTNYNICTDKTQYHLAKDPAFWKGLKVGDVVCGREVIHTAQRMTCCDSPMLSDLMSDEGTNWMVCRCLDCDTCGKIIKVDDPLYEDDVCVMGYCSKECRDKGWTDEELEEREEHTGELL